MSYLHRPLFVFLSPNLWIAKGETLNSGDQKPMVNGETLYSLLNINHLNCNTTDVAEKGDRAPPLRSNSSLQSLKLCSLFRKHKEPDRTFFSLPQEFHLQNSGSQAASCSPLPCCKNAAEVESLSPRWSQYPPVPLVSLLLQKSSWDLKT